MSHRSLLISVPDDDVEQDSMVELLAESDQGREEQVCLKVLCRVPPRPARPAWVLCYHVLVRSGMLGNLPVAQYYCIR